MGGTGSPIEPILLKLENLAEFSDADREDFLKLDYVVRRVSAGTTLFREDEKSPQCVALLTGFACRHRTLKSGARQIVSVHFPGDLINLQGGLAGSCALNGQMLTSGSVALIAAADLRCLSFERPVVQKAIWRQSWIDFSTCSEWMANVGRRDACARVAHLICEFATRLQGNGRAKMTFELPMTQEQIADATGLTAVHVNRTLQRLRRAGLIRGSGRAIEIADWQGLAAIAEFDRTYLGLSAHGRAHERERGRNPRVGVQNQNNQYLN